MEAEGLIPACGDGWVVLVRTDDGRQRVYGPCSRPRSIERLRLAILAAAGAVPVKRDPIVTRFWQRDEVGVASQFSPVPGTAPCMIGGGGPAPGVRLLGRCTTAIEHGLHGRGGVASIRLTEAWPKRRFNAGGIPRGGWLSHTWVFAVTGSGRIVARAQAGAAAPQYMS
jgi:hypothetical protein